MGEALVSGVAQPLERAVHDAARLLARARLPVISGMLSEAGAARAAIRLAEKCGGVFDHAASDATLDYAGAVRGGGTLSGAPEELKRLSSHVLMIGKAKANGFSCPVSRLKSPDDLGALRAAVAGRPHGSKSKGVGTIAASLKSASFCVICWRQDDLDAAETMMAMGMVRDLNLTTRASALPLGAASAADLVSGWLTGFPARTSLARGFAEHDPWAFSAQRLIESGEADLLIWVDGMPPRWAPPAVTLLISDCRADARMTFRTAPAEDGVYLSPETGTLVQSGTGASEAARILTMIMEAMP